MRTASRLSIQEFLDTTVDYHYVSARDVLREMIAAIGIAGLKEAINTIAFARIANATEQAELTAAEKAGAR
jgi:hypothetical protein